MEIYRAAGIPDEIVKRKYVSIEMSDGTRHDIWTVVIDSQPEADVEAQISLLDEKERPTLVMTHGYGSASCHLVLLLPELMKHFKIVMFDNLSFGSNSRDGVCNINRLDVE